MNLSISVLRAIGDQESIFALVYSQSADFPRNGSPIVVAKSKIDTVDVLAAGYPDCPQISAGEQCRGWTGYQLNWLFIIAMSHRTSSLFKLRAEGSSFLAAPFPWDAE